MRLWILFISIIINFVFTNNSIGLKFSADSFNVLWFNWIDLKFSQRDLNQKLVYVNIWNYQFIIFLQLS